MKWTQAFKVLTTDNAAHYWKIGMYRWSDNALVDEITTATATANATLQVSTITFDISSLTTSDIGLYILLTNVNSPGDFYTLVPAVELS